VAVVDLRCNLFNSAASVLRLRLKSVLKKGEDHNAVIIISYCTQTCWIMALVMRNSS
jgi:hypothetical protein